MKEEEIIKIIKDICCYSTLSFETNEKCIQAIQGLLDLYNKEKEKNNEIKNILKEKNIPIETLVAEWERLEGIEDDMTSAYISGVYDERAKWEKKENG